MFTKRQQEGYLLIDHSASPGVPDELLVPFGLPKGAGKGKFETGTYTCSHCQYVVVLHPDRSRDRAWCKKCDHYICDPCGAEMARTLICVPFQKTLDEAIVKSLVKS